MSVIVCLLVCCSLFLDFGLALALRRLPMSNFFPEVFLGGVISFCPVKGLVHFYFRCFRSLSTFILPASLRCKILRSLASACIAALSFMCGLAVTTDMNEGASTAMPTSFLKVQKSPTFSLDAVDFCVSSLLSLSVSSVLTQTQMGISSISTFLA